MILRINGLHITLLVLIGLNCSLGQDEFYSQILSDIPVPYKIEDLDIFDLLFLYMTPYGPNVSDECNEASEKYINTLNSPLTLANRNDQWAYKMYDASAKRPKTGVFSGKLHYPGNSQSCLEIDVSDEFTGKHCMNLAVVNFDIFNITTKGEIDENIIKETFTSLSNKYSARGINSLGTLASLGWIVLGRCIPSVCTDEDIRNGWVNFMNYTGEFIQLPEGSPSYFQFYPTSCHTKDETVPMESEDWGMVALIGVFGFLLCLGTVADCLLNIFKLDILPEKFNQIFQGFSIYNNSLRLFNTRSTGSDSISCLNGIRFLSLSWVVIGHVYSAYGPYGQALVNNTFELFDWIQDGAMSAVFNAFPSVDTFFLIGATLLSYITLKELDKSKGSGVVFWIKFYVHRYIRLTGVLAVIIFFHATLLKYFATGPYSFQITLAHDYCQKNWWQDLLYIQNFFFENDSCLGQTWYLANDFQFFIISPPIIWALWKFPIVGLVLSGILTSAATVVPLYLAWDNKWNFSPFFETREGYMKEFYVMPYARFQPYIVGIVLGYVLHKLRHKKTIDLNIIANLWLWLLATIIGGSVIYGLIPYQTGLIDGKIPPLADTVIYNGLHRLAWSLSISWMIFACAKGLGGPINTFLSWRAWAPLARMSYCMYLVHLTVIAYYNSLSSYTITVSHPLVVYFIIWVISVSALVSYICVIGFEMPIAHAERLLFSALGLTKLPKVTKTYVENKEEIKTEKKKEKKEEKIEEIAVETVDDKTEEIIEKKDV